MIIDVGIITYHSAYNFGSALQAYATQEIIKSLNKSCEIINYRMDAQKDYYSTIRVHQGIKLFVTDCLLIPKLFKKIKSARKFEDFFRANYLLSAEFSDPIEMLNYNGRYRNYLSGSDQIWNKHSCELEKNEWKYMRPYLFADTEGRKISYASSVANMKKTELEEIIPFLNDFNALSMREQDAAEYLKNVLNRPVFSVLDPTFLLNSDQWVEKLKLKKESKGKRCLLYSLSGVKSIAKIKKVIDKLLTEGFTVDVITPNINIWSLGKKAMDCRDYGPVEFLNAIYNASLVMTDSYHGTILSINFNTPFYSINGDNDSDNRKTNILNMLGMMSRNIKWEQIENLKIVDRIDFTNCNNILQKERKKSVDYLQKSLV